MGTSNKAVMLIKKFKSSLKAKQDYVKHSSSSKSNKITKVEDPAHVLEPDRPSDHFDTYRYALGSYVAPDEMLEVQSIEDLRRSIALVDSLKAISGLNTPDYSTYPEGFVDAAETTGSPTPDIITSTTTDYIDYYGSSTAKEREIFDPLAEIEPGAYERLIRGQSLNRLKVTNIPWRETLEYSAIRLMLNLAAETISSIKKDLNELDDSGLNKTNPFKYRESKNRLEEILILTVESLSHIDDYDCYQSLRWYYIKIGAIEE